jgi:repressor of nif and glnA expression
MKRNLKSADPNDQLLLSDLIYLHILHAADSEPIDALRMAERLLKRGYKVSYRSVSALMRKFERRGWLARTQAVQIILAFSG